MILSQTKIWCRHPSMVRIQAPESIRVPSPDVHVNRAPGIHSRINMSATYNPAKVPSSLLRISALVRLFRSAIGSCIPSSAIIAATHLRAL